MMKRCSCAIALLLTALAACDSGTGLTARAGVAVSFATQSPLPAPAAPFRTAGVVLTDTMVTGTDTLIITSAQLVLRQVKFAPQETVTCNVDPTPPGCEDVELGPALVDLPLTPGTQPSFQADLPAGTYGKVEFEIHKISSGDAADAAFLAQHPEFADLSIRVEGTFNGQAFTYSTDLDVEQELTLVPALVIGSTTGSTNVTILVDVSGWFVVSSALVDPNLGNKGGQFESQIKENIKQSIEAFEDADRDGGKD